MSLKNINRLKRAVWSVLYIAEALIFARFVTFVYTGELNGFIFFLREISNFLIWPFDGMFPVFIYKGYNINLDLIFAMCVYYVIAWSLVRLLRHMENLPETTIE